MVEPEKFEDIFSRVMCLLPPEDLQNILIHGAQAPFSNEDQQKLSELVQQGFRDWKEFHVRYGNHQNQILQQDPGLATWEDLSLFLQNYSKTISDNTFNESIVTGNTANNFNFFSVLKMEDDKTYLCGDPVNKFITGLDGKIIPKIGLNLPPVIKAIRTHAFPELSVGAASLRWNQESSLPDFIQSNFFVVLVFIKQTIKTDSHFGWSEKTSNTICYVLEQNKDPKIAEGIDKSKILRGIFKASYRTRVDDISNDFKDLKKIESEIYNIIRKPTREEIDSGYRHAVTPIFAGVIYVK
jgi:hypothetical protein